MPERAFTQWSPDTCDCVIQYYNDDQTHCATVKKCAKHAQHVGPAHLDAVLSHNRQKNAVVEHLRQTAGIAPDTIAAGYGPVDAKSGDDPVIISGLPQLAKVDLQSALDNRFGQGRVKII